MSLNFSFRAGTYCVVAALSLALSGCALSDGTAATGASSETSASQRTIGGNVHGGSQPVIGATVVLWAAGTTGTYGTGAKAIAVTTTDGAGSFSFNVGGTSPCTTGQLLYVTANGGNTGGGTNTASAMMAANPAPCNAATGSNFLFINEASTVAAVWSLQQFMSINTSGTEPTATSQATPPWTIGSPSSNVIGLTNAFAQVVQLADTAAASSAITTVSNTVTATASSTGNGGTYSTVITPDSARINTLADILASCVNTTGSSVCSSLFADTTPSGSTAPIDTIQSAYYLATNPAGLTMPVHSAANSPTWLCTNYVAAAGAPFVPALTCGSNTNDWLIGVKWGTYNSTVNGSIPCGTTGSTCVGTVYVAGVAVDGNGNIWTGAGTGITGTLLVNQFSPTGLLNIAPVSTVNIPAYSVAFDVAGTTTNEAYTGSSAYALGYERPNGLAVDTNNNAWFAAYGATSPGTLGSTVTLPTGVVTQITPGGVATGYLTGTVPGALAVDGSNNVYLSDQPVSGRYYMSELTAASNYQTLNEGVARATSIYNSVFVDPSVNQYAWALSSSTTCTNYVGYRANTAEAASSSTAADVTFTANCAGYGASDALANAWISYGGNLYYENVASSLTATTTTITGSTNTSATGASGTGGLDNANGVAIDGLGHVWTFNRPATGVAGGLSEFATTTSSGTTTYTALSPSGAGIFGFQADGLAAGSGSTPVIDASGNVWITPNGGSFLYHMVGAAAPVVTPTALAISNGAVGSRP